MAATNEMDLTPPTLYHPPPSPSKTHRLPPDNVKQLSQECNAGKTDTCCLFLECVAAPSPNTVQ